MENNQGRGLYVQVRYNGPTKEDRDRALDRALQQLKKAIMREGLIQELRDRQYFKSKSQKRYEKRRSNIHRKNRQNNEPKY